MAEMGDKYRRILPKQPALCRRYSLSSNELGEMLEQLNQCSKEGRIKD